MRFHQQDSPHLFLGYICAGYLQKKNFSDEDYWLVKLNRDGEIMWNKTHDSGTGFDRAYSVYETNDGYIIAGEYDPSDSSSSNIWIVKTTKNGDHTWSRSYAGYRSEGEAYYIDQLEDKSYIIAGKTDDKGVDSPVDSDLWVLRIAENGNKLWDKQLGDIDNIEAGYCIKKTDDDGYVVLAGKEIDDDNEMAWLIKLKPITFDYKPDTPSGPSSGSSDVSYTYITKAEHPAGHEIQYGWDWNGDQIVDEWTEFYPSDEEISRTHTWNTEGIKYVRVIARENNELTSKWSEPLAVNIPKTKHINYPFIYQIFERIFGKSLIFELIFN